MERARFAGVCYRAAGWFHAGATTGRSRNDDGRIPPTPVKEVYLKPLMADWQRRLTA